MTIELCLKLDEKDYKSMVLIRQGILKTDDNEINKTIKFILSDNAFMNSMNIVRQYRSDGIPVYFMTLDSMKDISGFINKIKRKLLICKLLIKY
jgi:hypothetical protein